MRRRIGSDVLKAVASPLRLGILHLLYENGELTYTEIMSLQGLSPSRDAGRFAYHLKTLLKSDLIEPDSSSKKYVLTDLGKTIVEFSEDIENDSYIKQLLVRTSRLSIENFDRNRIGESLIREAEVPAELAQRIGREAEKRLLKLGTKYLTAPLIREFVNAILLERGLEEYRHRLTRLGLPVYDVTILLKEMSKKALSVDIIHNAAGNRVFEEYTLLNVLPRNISDAHISGSIDLNNLGSWILKPTQIMHDLRLFFQHGFSFISTSKQKISIKPPQNLKSALSLITNIVKLTSSEISSEQGLDYFNILLAPFSEGMTNDEIRSDLNLFLQTMNLMVPSGVSIGLETILPNFLSEGKINVMHGNSRKYSDYFEESQRISTILLECLGKTMNEGQSIFNPAVIIKIRSQKIPEMAEEVLYKAHSLACEGITYFANLSKDSQSQTSYNATGLRLEPNWKNDWELDTVRTGCLDQVTLNLPRAIYDSNKNQDKIFENIQDIINKGIGALENKYYIIEARIAENLLPFLGQKKDGDPYMRINNTICLVSFIGLNEATTSLTGKSIYESTESLSLALGIARYLKEQIQINAKKLKMRLKLGHIANPSSSKRLAELDVEKFGFGRVKIMGSRENPYYTELMEIPLVDKPTFKKNLNILKKIQQLTSGNRLLKISLGEFEYTPEELISTTKNIIQDSEIELYTYDRNIMFCNNCRKTTYRSVAKCPVCGSVNSIIFYARQPAKYSVKNK